MAVEREDGEEEDEVQYVEDCAFLPKTVGIAFLSDSITQEATVVNHFIISISVPTGDKSAIATAYEARKKEVQSAWEH